MKTFKEKEARLNELWKKQETDEGLTKEEDAECEMLEKDILQSDQDGKRLTWPKQLAIQTNRGKVIYNYDKKKKEWIQQTKPRSRRMWSIAIDDTDENESYIYFIDMLTSKKLFTFFIKKCIRWYQSHPEALEDLLNR